MNTVDAEPLPLDHTFLYSCLRSITLQLLWTLSITLNRLLFLLLGLLWTLNRWTSSRDSSRQFLLIHQSITLVLPRRLVLVPELQLFPLPSLWLFAIAFHHLLLLGHLLLPLRHLSRLSFFVLVTRRILHLGS
jgi:hypothetical protein